MARSIFARVSKGRKSKMKSSKSRMIKAHQLRYGEQVTVSTNQETKDSRERRAILDEILEIIKVRFLEALDEFIALLFAVLSVALIYGIMRMVFILVGIEEDSFKFKSLGYIILFVEACLILKFLWNRLQESVERKNE